jgi:nitrite reductase/ring-hydroxylating ferredoxin subunit
MSDQPGRLAPTRYCPGCGAVDRRTFLAQTALAAGVGAFLAGCAAGGSDITAPQFSGPLVVTPAAFPALSTLGGIARVDGGEGSPVAVVRTGDAQYAAFSLVCPHQGATVNIGGPGFQCPQHGARFATDGTWVGGQPTSNLRALSVAYDSSNGSLTIT